MNHLYNSQQLSNKALLAGHLAYRHDHHRGRQQLRARLQCSEGRGDLSNSCGHDDYSCRAAGPGAAAAAEIRPGLEEALETKITNPEAFFPRCWDVSDDADGVCSMLKAFAAAAAVALLRTAVKAEVWWGGARFCSHVKYRFTRIVREEACLADMILSSFWCASFETPACLIGGAYTESWIRLMVSGRHSYLSVCCGVCSNYSVSPLSAQPYPRPACTGEKPPEQGSTKFWQR